MVKNPMVSGEDPQQNHEVVNQCFECYASSAGIGSLAEFMDGDGRRLCSYFNIRRPFYASSSSLIFSERKPNKHESIVLLNISNEKVDPTPEPEELCSRESMLDHIEERGFC